MTATAPGLVVVVVVVLVLSIASTSRLVSGQIVNCQWNGWDVSSLATQDIQGSDRDYQYLLRVCGAVQSEQACETKGGSLCQYAIGQPPAYKHTLAQWDGTGRWSECNDPTNCPAGGVSITFKNGDLCTVPGQQPRTVTFDFICTLNAYGSIPRFHLSCDSPCLPVVCVNVLVLNHYTNSIRQVRRVLYRGRFI